MRTAWIILQIIACGICLLIAWACDRAERLARHLLAEDRA